MDSFSSSWGPGHTPKVVRWLIILTCIVSLLSALTNNLFVQFLKMTGPVEFFGLSWRGLRWGYFWQPVTYLFVQDPGGNGIHFFYLISLLFDMYVLWVIGSMVIERLGSMRFIVLYLLTGVLAGLAAVGMMTLIGSYSLITGPSAALLGLLVVWTMYYPDSDLMLFFLFPIKLRWLLTGVLGAIFIVSLSQLDFVSLTFYGVATLTGYLFGLISCGLRSPFAFTRRFDLFVIRLSNRLFGTTASNEKSKVVDIQSDDDAFVDAMLSKISKQGEKSLTSRERRRMQEISARKMQKKH